MNFFNFLEIFNKKESIKEESEKSIVMNATSNLMKNNNDFLNTFANLDEIEQSYEKIKNELSSLKP